MYSNSEQRKTLEIYEKLKELEPSIAPESHEIFMQTIEQMSMDGGEGAKLPTTRSDYFDRPSTFDFFARFLNRNNVSEENYQELMEMAGGSEWKEWMCRTYHHKDYYKKFFKKILKASD